MTPQRARQTISELIALVANSDLADLELADGDLRLRLHRPKSKGTAEPFATDSSDGIEGNLALGDTANEPRLVRSTLVGRFHRGHNGRGDPLVHEGDSVEPGQALGVVEALNTFTNVVSEDPGRVVRILVGEGDRVEYGQPLIELE